jgi:hypothetical protein
MKPVVIIAIVAVAMIGVMVPSVFADHDPNYVEKWHQGCKDGYDNNVYVEGQSTKRIEDAYQRCVSQVSYPPIPMSSNDCKIQYEQGSKKIERALEVGHISQDNVEAEKSYLKKQLQTCNDKSVTKQQQKCYVQLSNLTYQQENVARYLHESKKVSGSIQDYYDNALTKYNHCMGVKPDSLSKEPIFITSDQIIKDQAHKQCEEQWEKHSIFVENYDGYEAEVDTYQIYNTCVNEYSFEIKSHIPKKCDEVKPYNIEEWSLTGKTFDTWNKCQIDAASELYHIKSESIINSKISCGPGTEDVDGICQVIQTEEKSSKGGGCLIATATYGSELSPQVQQLRELRDNQLLQTESGTAFMGTFNDIYYSFSPIIADYERENPLFKEIVKLAITPMISSLSLMENAESESEVISLGLSVIMLNIGMYLGIPAVVIVGIRKSVF